MGNFFEYCISEGEGIVTVHACYAVESPFAWTPMGLMFREGKTLTFERVSAERYAEFITIHGSEVAV